jgi:hypothetical protein
MGMNPLSVDRLVPTSSCPVVAGGGSFELWPMPIFLVVMTDMRLLQEDEPMTCVE